MASPRGPGKTPRQAREWISTVSCQPGGTLKIELVAIGQLQLTLGYKSNHKVTDCSKLARKWSSPPSLRMISSISILRWKASGLIKAKVPCKYIWPGIASTISVNQQVIKVYSELGSNVSLHNIKALVYNLLGPQVHPIYCIGWQISVQHYYKERKEWIPAGGAWCPVCHTTVGAPVPDKKTHRPTSVWASIPPSSSWSLRLEVPDQKCPLQILAGGSTAGLGVSNAVVCVGNWVLEVPPTLSHTSADRFCWSHR